METPKQVHVVFGAGQIGPAVARQLVARGHEVRIARRSSGAVPEGVKLFSGDAADPAFVREATAGAHAVYHCMNPAYSSGEWKAHLPRWRAALVDGCGRAGARLVLLDNVYAFGNPQGRPLNEDAAINPCSRKGEIRAREWEAWLSAYRAGSVRVTCGRGSDFYGPGGTQTYFGDAFMPGALRKGVAQTISRLDTRHTYHFTHDVSAGLVTLGTSDREDVEGRWWMLPCAPADTTRGMIERIGRALGRSLTVKPVPGFVFAGLALVMPMMRELREMAYQWDGDFVMDDQAFRLAFGGDATALDAGIADLVAWARQHYVAAP